MAERPRAVFLDRDGVINRAVMRDGRPHPPQSVAELEILPGVAEAIVRLQEEGYEVVVVTNQPDIARGTTTRAQVDAIHECLRERLRLDDIRVCPHDDDDECQCRKPKPGLWLEPPEFDLAASAIVGDRWRDIEAGRAAGVGVTILVDYGYDERLPHDPSARVSTLAEAVDWLLSHGRGHGAGSG